MRIRSVPIVPVRSGFSTDDQAAIRAGRVRDGRPGARSTLPAPEDVRDDPDSIVVRPRDVAPVVQDSAVARPIREGQ